jgi:GTPase SAR1 family protein
MAPRLLVEKYGTAVANQLDMAKRRNSGWLGLAECNLTQIPEEVFELTELRSIDLSRNELRSLPEQLWTLPNLQSINLVGNPIESLPNVPGLILDVPTYLRLHGAIDSRNLTLIIDEKISQRHAISLLRLRVTKTLLRVHVGTRGRYIGVQPDKPNQGIQRILDSLAHFEALESLSLNGIKLNAVPEDIRKLSHLKKLNTDCLGLDRLPNWIGELGLESFSAVDNKLSSLPESFRNLQSLKALSLSWNPLKRMPNFIYDLRSLEALDIQNCEITEIAADILRPINLKIFISSGNPFESPPLEVSNKGLEAIRNYWRQRADTGVDYLCEAKLIILGESGAGKTSLAKKIENPNYKLEPSEKSTEGIDVIRYRFPTVIRTREDVAEKVIERDFEVNIWDFGGQEIYHATHQFFLTRRSVYVLVCDDRKEDTDFSYWLQVVEMLSDASPLLIVQNEKQDRKRDINLSSLRAQFANLRNALATNLDTNRGLDDVIRLIRKELESLPHVGVGLPATWKRVREALEDDPRDYISLEEYLRICQEHGFTLRQDKLQLSGYLHDLGICLHFQDDPLLKNTVILKPSWGTDAVYGVLDDPEVTAARGLFTRKELTRIWSEEKYVGMQDELLRLMMKFQLCYELETDQAFIAPQLLSSEQPPYPWEATGGLVVRYEYGFLPKGIVTRFIVAMHWLIAGGQLVWKTGVVLEHDGTRAEIIEEYLQRRIRVRVVGPEALGLLAIVNNQLERLHNSFPRLQYERFLPCPCAECRAKSEPYGFALERLLNMARKKQNIQCHISGEMVDAAQLVLEIMPGALRRDNRRAEPSLADVGSKTLVPTPEVFVSYSWAADSNKIVDKLQEAFEHNGIRIIRDREEVRYKDSMRDFMRRIGQGKCVVVVISDKYLKSENCMFEMIEIAKTPVLRERIFPIVLSDANIYKATGRIKYVRYWEDEIQELDEALKTVRGDNLTKLQEDLNLYSEIRRLFDGITDTLRDMNALTPDQHEGSGFEELIGRIRAQLAV